MNKHSWSQNNVMNSIITIFLDKVLSNTAKSSINSNYCFPFFPTYKISFFLLSLKTQQWFMPTQPRSQCFFPNAEQLIGEESQSIALCYERSPRKEVDAHKDHCKTLSYQQCVNAFKSVWHFWSGTCGSFKL